MRRFSKESWGVAVSTLLFLFFDDIFVIPPSWHHAARFLKAALLAFSVAGWLLAHFRSVRKFRSQPKGNHPVTLVTVALIGALMAIGIWFFTQHEGDEVAQNTDATPPSKVETKPAYATQVITGLFYTAPSPMSPFMVMYPSLHGATASPVPFLMYIQITNLTDHLTAIQDYSVSVSDSKDGSWEALYPISLTSTNLVATKIENAGKGPGGGQIELRRAYRLDTPMTIEDLKKSVLLEPDSKLELRLRQSIPAHETITGWAAFDSKKHEQTTVPKFFQIRLRDSLGLVSSEIASLPTREGEEAGAQTRVGILTVTGTGIDLSQAHVRYFSDPIVPKQP